MLLSDTFTTALNGLRAKGAMDRYTSGTVIKPESEDTQSSN